MNSTSLVLRTSYKARCDGQFEASSGKKVTRPYVKEQVGCGGAHLWWRQS
jgi:hypothetical protein